MHLTTVYESLPHIVMPPAVLFDRPVEITWTELPLNSIRLKPTNTTATQENEQETAAQIMARIGKWEGEPLVREPQGYAEERDPIL